MLTAYDNSQTEAKKKKGAPTPVLAGKPAEADGARTVTPNLSAGKGTEKGNTAQEKGGESEGAPQFGPVRKGGLLERAKEKMAAAAKAVSEKVLKKAGLNDFLAKKSDKDRPLYKYVYYKDGYGYATNGRKLIKFKADYPKEWEGKAVLDNKVTDTGGTFGAGSMEDILGKMLGGGGVMRVDPEGIRKSLAAIRSALYEGRKKNGHPLNDIGAVQHVALDSDAASVEGSRRNKRYITLSDEMLEAAMRLVDNAENAEVYTIPDGLAVTADGMTAVFMRTTPEREEAVWKDGRVYLSENGRWTIKSAIASLSGKEKEAATPGEAESIRQQREELEKMLSEAGDLDSDPYFQGIEKDPFLGRKFINKDGETVEIVSVESMDGNGNPQYYDIGIDGHGYTVPAGELRKQLDSGWLREVKEEPGGDVTAEETSSEEPKPVGKEQPPEGGARLREGGGETKGGGSVEQTIADLSKRLNHPVRIANSPDEITDPEARAAIEKGRPVKGYYDPETGEVVVYAPNAGGAEDAARTVLHEVVGHSGLRGLIGKEQYDTAMGNLYKRLPKAAHDAVDAMKDENGWSVEKAMDEYLAGRAEDSRKPSWWSSVVSAVRSLLRSAGFNIDLTDADIDYMLWRSRNRLEGGMGSLLDRAADVAMRVRMEKADAEEAERKTRLREDDEERKRIREANDRFNTELQQQIDGTLPKSHVYQLGKPGNILRACGFPDVRIELTAARLANKANQDNHVFSLSDMRNLVEAINDPIAVFTYGSGGKAQNVIVEMERDGKKFLVGVHFDVDKSGAEVNIIKGLFNKDTSKWLNWVSQGKAVYINKEKIRAVVDKQRTNSADVEYLNLDSVAKVIEDFENPKLSGEKTRSEGEKSEGTPESGGLRFRETDPDKVGEATDKAIAESARKLAKSLGAEVETASSPEEVTDPEARRAIEQGRSISGWYDTKTGRVVIYMPNVKGEADATRTVLHEVVGHKGLRSLIGESSYDAMMRSLLKELPQEQRQALEERAKAKGWTAEVAMDEYLAERAETAEKPTWWGKAVAAVREALRAMGLDLKLTDADIDYMLWRSRSRLEGGKGSLLDRAADVALRARADRAWKEERRKADMETLEGVRGQKTPGRPAAAFGDDQRLPLGTTSGYSSGQPAAAPRGGLRFGTKSLGKRRRAEMLATLNKRRDDMEDGQKEALLNVIADTYERDGGAVAEAAFKWFTDGTVRLPEDMDKIRQAVQVAKKAGVDPASYKSPMDLINQHAEFKVSGERVDPDKVTTLKNKRELANGVTVYDVDESEESRRNMRKIIDTHWGMDCNPWCLLQGDNNGNLTEQSAGYWKHYSEYPKRVAFKDGRLLAFFASDGEPTWWDRQDHPHSGLPVTRKMDDGSGRVATYEMDEETGEFNNPTNIHKGNKQNGEYEEWYDEKQIEERSHWKDGKPDGLKEEWYESGQLAYRTAYKDGKLDGLEGWYESGQLAYRTAYKDGKLDGLDEEWYESGQPKYRKSYKDGKLDGPYETWNANGQLISRGKYKDGEPDGLRFREDDGEEKPKEKKPRRQLSDKARQVTEEYNKAMRSSRVQVAEAMWDSMKTLKEFMQITSKAAGRKLKDIADVEGFMNPYLGENRLPSVNKHDQDMFKRRHLDGLYKAIDKLTGGTEEGRRGLFTYMKAKHGVEERNPYMAERYAREEYEKTKAKGAPAWEDLDEETRQVYTSQMRRDYAGLTGLFTGEDGEKPSWQEAERMARECVESYEADHDTGDLWKRVKKLTDAILKKERDTGLISTETYDRVRSMYRHYIPLRGFMEPTADQMYAYIGQPEGSGGFSDPMKGAKGRTSEADDPITNLVKMAQSAIIQGNRNQNVRLPLLRFVRNHAAETGDLVSVSGLWLERDGRRVLPRAVRLREGCTSPKGVSLFKSWCAPVPKTQFCRFLACTPQGEGVGVFLGGAPVDVGEQLY